MNFTIPTEANMTNDKDIFQETVSYSQEQIGKTKSIIKKYGADPERTRRLTKQRLILKALRLIEELKWEYILTLRPLRKEDDSDLAT